MLARARGLGMPLEEHINSGAISVQQIDPAELSPGEFAGLIRRTVQGDGDKKPARVLIIDSLNGYINAMPEERFLVIQMHELLTYLGQRGVLTLLIVAHHGIIGQLDSPVDTSYLADTVLATQHFELNGHLRQSLAIIKKRSGPHEHTIREMTMDSSGIHLSPPLDGAHGILTGVPTTNERPT
jgi:circadian clock protein KaiC